MRFLPLATVILVGATVTLPAVAGDSASAEALYRSAKEAAKKKDWPTACAQFAESHRLDPAPGTLINLADCEEKRGLVASAWTHFVEVEKKFKPGDSRIKFAHDHAAALEKRIPKITVKLDPPADGVKVYRDDVELGAASLGVALPVDPGAHVIKTVSANGEEKKFPINVSEGTATDVVVSGVAAAPAQAPTTPAPVAAPIEKKPEATPPPPTPAVVVVEPSSNGNRTLGYALLGGGAIGIAIGAVTGVVALSKASEVKDTCGADYLTCTSSSVDAASAGKTMTTVSTVGFIVGGVLAAAGMYFAFIAPDPKKRTTASRAFIDLGVGSVRGTF